MRDRGNHPLVNRRGVGLAILLLFFPGPLFPAVKQPLAASRDEQFNGRWDIKTSGERPRAWWLEIENAGTPAAKGKFISAFSGDLNVIEQISTNDGTLRFGWTRQQRPSPGGACHRWSKFAQSH